MADINTNLDYKKYRWFFTKSGKLVYGGKSAEQNEEIVQAIMTKTDNYIMMHTRIPGSPFAIIDANLKNVSEQDLEEVAIWTACFSRAWRSGLKKTTVDIFTKKQIVKKQGMKTGTFGVEGKIERKNVILRMCLIYQKKVLRAVPETTLKEDEKILMNIIPGKIPKEQFAKMISEKLKKQFEEVLNALPTGNFGVVK